MKKKILSLSLAVATTLSLSACGTASSSSSTSSSRPHQESTVEAMELGLSDQGITLDGIAVTEGSDGAVMLSHDIVYYHEGTDETYGEGTQADMHSASEADAHQVVTIRQPGTYRVTGELSAGQLAIDLGEDAKGDPSAVVTLILDDVDITCTVAPALIFYNVYECDTAWVAYDEGEASEYQDSPSQDTSSAGANIILADGSLNKFKGAYVARIYKEGTTKKLHKYDGAFYSKMSMNIGSQAEGSGVLNIVGSNEGLDSEMHLTINGGTINIQAQNDGINTNEDFVSVTTINGGTLQINAGLGAEGDGIDSNGHLVINGGNVYTMANERTPDGGIDADGDILINGGYVVALGTRNDALSSGSAQDYMELSFASTLPAGSNVELSDPRGAVLLSFETEKACQSITFTSADLEQNTPYTLKVDGVIQQYTGNSSGGFGGTDFNRGNSPLNIITPPDSLNEWLNGTQDIPDDIRSWLEDVSAFTSQFAGGKQGRFDPPQMPQGQAPETSADLPQGSQNGDDRSQMVRPGRNPSQTDPTVKGSVQFVLSQQTHSFSGISDSAQDSGKIQVSFSAEVSVTNGVVTVSNIQASADVDPSHVQLTVADVPSEDYSASCLWSEGDIGIAGILPENVGTYQLTIAMTGDSNYTGASQFQFSIE